MKGRVRQVCCLAAAAIVLACGANRLTAASEKERTISFYNIHTHETLTSVYKKNGKYVREEMEKINWVLRDWRRDEKTDMDPELIDLVWEMHNELGSREPIHVISGYRSRNTNDMLRKSVGGQASQSRHILGKAMDVHFPDVPVKNLRYSALIRERGGVGYYPTSAIPFVHVDTDRVRSWPRLPRTELALLFPNGRTQHLPDDGDPITKEDVRAARTKHAELAVQIAEFHHLRTQPKPPLQMASLTPPLPQLLSAPRLIERSSLGLGTRPTDAERARLAELAEAPRLLIGPTPVSRKRPAEGSAGAPEYQLAAADPAAGPGLASRLPLLGRDTAFVPAPAYDDEHPEELSYRPFPIAPLLTATASPDDPALAHMVHPDIAKTLELLDQPSSAPPLRLRPGPQAAQLLWAQQFKGEAINLSSFADTEAPGSGSRLANRRVQTQPQ